MQTAAKGYCFRKQKQQVEICKWQLFTHLEHHCVSVQTIKTQDYNIFQGDFLHCVVVIMRVESAPKLPDLL